MITALYVVEALGWAVAIAATVWWLHLASKETR